MRQYFYAVGDEQRGPIPEDSLLNLFRLGSVTSQTLVWSEGMPDWQRLGEVFPHWVSEAVSASGAADSENAVCAVSGRLLPKADMIAFGDVWVSPESRDVYLQRLQQGLPATPLDLVPASMWVRFGAILIDLVLVGLLPFGAVVIVLLASPDPEAAGEVVPSLVGVGWFLCLALYDTLCIALWSKTLGHRIFGIEVVRTDGGRPGFGAAAGRAAIKYILCQCCSGLILIVSLIIAIGNKPWHQSLHDQTAKTYVVKRRR